METKMFVCPFCDEIVEIINSIEGHHAVCDECGKSFRITPSTMIVARILEPCLSIEVDTV